MSAPDPRLDAVIARSELTDLLARYSSMIDWFRWDWMDGLFWPESRFDYGLFKGDYPTFRDFVIPLEESYSRRLHMYAMPNIMLSGDTASVDAGSVIVCRGEDPAPGVDEIFWGRYIFSAERRGDEWRFTGITYVLNLLDRTERTEDDRNDMMNFGDELSPSHPFAPR